MSNILLWQSVAKDNWSYRFINRETAFLAYKINRLPDFTEHRFGLIDLLTEKRLS